MTYYLGIDIGGTSMKCAIMNEEGDILERQKILTPSTLDQMYQNIKECFESFKNYQPQGLALSMPGAVDSEKGVIGGSSAIPYIHGPHIKNDLEKLLNVRVEIENDANCAALAEVWKGAGKDVDDCCFIVSGSGIGGAVVKDKRIHKGKHLHGGEFGYMISLIDYETEEMTTWSWAGSTVAVVKDVAQQMGVDMETLDGKYIFDHYHENKFYKKAVNRFYWALASGIYNLQYAYDPEKIIIGGAVSVRDDLIDEVQKRLDIIFEKFTHAKIKPSICTCMYHNDANILGALYHFLTINS